MTRNSMTRRRLVTWNADGLVDKTLEFVQLLQDLDVDVALVQETFLRLADSLKIANYAVYRNDRPAADRASGGTAIFVHPRIPHRRIQRNVLAPLEVTSVAIPHGGGELEISPVYNPPGRILQPATLDLILQSGAPALLAGNFNSKHRDFGCRKTNTGGRRLQDYLHARPVSLAAPADPTHYPYAGHEPDILDFALTCSLGAAVEVRAFVDLSSDHVPVIIDFTDDQAPLAPPHRPAKVNWGRYANYLVDREHQQTPPAETPELLDQKVQDLTSLPQEAVHASVGSDDLHKSPS